MGSYSMWCNRPRMALDGRKSTSPSSGACHFLDEHIHRSVLSVLWVNSLADSLLYLVSLPLDCMCTREMLHSSAGCSLFRPCRQALFGKGDRQVRLLFALTKSQRTTTCQNATQHWLDLHLQRQPLIPLRVLKLGKLKTSSRLSAICCALATFCNHEFAPTMYRLAWLNRASSMHRAGYRTCEWIACCMQMVDRATRSCRGRGTSCMPAGLAIFFFLDRRIHGSSKIRTDPRRIRIDPGFGGFVLPLVRTLPSESKSTLWRNQGLLV